MGEIGTDENFGDRRENGGGAIDRGSTVCWA